MENCEKDRRRGGEECGAGIEVTGEVVFEANRKTQEGTGGRTHGAAAGGRRSCDGAMDGRSVEGLAIAGGPVCAHIKLGGEGACEQEREQETPSDAEVRGGCGGVGKHGRNIGAQRGATATDRAADRPTGMTQLH